MYVPFSLTSLSHCTPLQKPDNGSLTIFLQSADSGVRVAALSTVQRVFSIGTGSVFWHQTEHT